MTEAFREELKKGLGFLGLEFEEERAEKLYHFYMDLFEKNSVMNLTAITEMKDVVYKHFIDSLSPVLIRRELKEAEAEVIDIGSGAGFPGIPMAIAFPDLKIVMIDSVGKKVKFIQEEIGRLELKNAHAVHARSEDLARDGNYREKFDYAVSRAVANLSTLLEYSIPFIHNNGNFLPLKSGKVDEEIEAAQNALIALHCRLEQKLMIDLPEGYGGRTLLSITKLSPTDKRYPRKAGIPSRKPL